MDMEKAWAHLYPFLRIALLQTLSFPFASPFVSAVGYGLDLVWSGRVGRFGNGRFGWENIGKGSEKESTRKGNGRFVDVVAYWKYH